MKKIRFLTIIALAALSSCATVEGGFSLAEAIEQSVETIADVLPAGSRVAIVAWESPSAGLSDYIMEELTGALVDRDMEMADRQNLEYVYRELNLRMSGDVSDERARSIGKFLGADLVITGRLTDLGGPYHYRASAIHVETAVRDSVTRLDVKGDAVLWRMATALDNQKSAQKSAVKTAAYRDGAKPAPRTAGAFLDRGITLASQGEFESAIMDFTESIKLNPQLNAAYFNRGYAHLVKKDYDRAVADFTQAINLDPNLVNAYNDRGVAYAGKGDYDRAVADFTQAINLDPSLALAHNNRGIAHYNKGDYDPAVADYTQAIKLDPNYALAYYNRGCAYDEQGDCDRAIADYTQAINLDLNYALAYCNRGCAYAGKGDYERAVADYTQVIRINPDYPGVYTNRGVAYYYNGDYDCARADWNKALQLDPNDATARNNLDALGDRGQ